MRKGIESSRKQSSKKRKGEFGGRCKECRVKGGVREGKGEQDKK